jgi:predicted transcriptional regulator
MHTQNRGYLATDYDTRIDRFRRREGLTVEVWAEAAAMERNTLYRIRAGKHAPRASTLAQLVRAAAKLLQRNIKASEMYDLGEEVPVAPARISLSARSRTRVRRQGTRFDAFLATHDIAPNRLARASRLSRQTLTKMRCGLIDPSVRTIAAIVRALRESGYHVMASEIADVGESLSA